MTWNQHWQPLPTVFKADTVADVPGGFSDGFFGLLYPTTSYSLLSGRLAGLARGIGNNLASPPKLTPGPGSSGNQFPSVGPSGVPGFVGINMKLFSKTIFNAQAANLVSNDTFLPPGVEWLLIQVIGASANLNLILQYLAPSGTNIDILGRDITATDATAALIGGTLANPATKRILWQVPPGSAAGTQLTFTVSGYASGSVSVAIFGRDRS